MNIKVNVDEYKHKINYKRFLNEPNSGFCITGKFNVTHLCKLRKTHKFNCMLLFCIQQAGQKCDFLHYFINDDELFYNDNVSVNMVTYGKDDEIYYVGFNNHSVFSDFENEYLKSVKLSYEECKSIFIEDGAKLATSTVKDFPITSFSCSNTSDFKDNFVMIGGYEKHLFKTYVNITLRFNHALLDGREASQFFKQLQKEINEFKI